MPEKLNIVLVGAGNLATHLGPALKAAGHKIIQVYSPGVRSAQTLARKLRTEAVSEIRRINKDADLYILAVKDDAIADVAHKLKVNGGLVVHTSGSAKMNLLKGISGNYGVFYPLQTFSKNRSLSMKNVPVCIEGNNKTNTAKLSKIAQGISKKVQEIDSDQRKAIHLAAVFASNFSNHMYAIAANILASEKIPFEILLPLIRETAEKINESSPAEAQTGPAIRGDQQTMKEHLKLLRKDKQLHKLYKLISGHIAK